MIREKYGRVTTNLVDMSHQRGGRLFGKVFSVLDGFNGMHFRNQDFEDLAWKIKQMTPECANQLGANGYQSYWASPLTEDKYFDSLLEYYQSILAQ